MFAGLPVTVSVHVHESAVVKANTHSAAGGFALLALSDGHSTVDLFFQHVADLDRVTEAIGMARHELAALIEHEPSATTAEQDQVATHAYAA